MKFGNYYLGQNFHEVENELEDISEQMFSSGIMKVFNDERIFKGKKVTFLDHSWDTVIGVTNDKVYKIALQYKSVKAESVFNSLFKYFKEKFGNPGEHRNYKNSFFNIWDTEWGNIILEQKDEGDEELINIFLTSHMSSENKRQNTVRKDSSDDLLFLIVSLVISLVIFFIGRFFGNRGIFISLLLISVFIGRQVGNRISKFFYFAKTGAIIFIGLLWGGIVALLFRLFFLWTHPGIILTIIGYGGGLYTSIINYDVFMRNPRLTKLLYESNLMTRGDDNQEIINFASIGSFVILSIIFYFLLK